MRKTLAVVVVVMSALSSQAGIYDQCLYYRWTNCGIAAASPAHFDLVRSDDGNVRVWWKEDCEAPNLTDLAAADATAVAWVEAQRQPVEFPNGIAIPESTSTNPAYCLGIENGAVVTWVAHSSPYDPAVAESNRVAALTERSTLRSDLRVLKGVAQTNKAQVQAIVAWTNGVTAGQQRSDFNDLRRELIDANDTIIKLTRLVRQLLKEQNP